MNLSKRKVRRSFLHISPYVVNVEFDVAAGMGRVRRNSLVRKSQVA